MERFSLELAEYRFELEVKLDEKDDTGKNKTRIDHYVIRELDGVQREDHSEKIANNLKHDGDKIVGFKNVRGTSVALLQRCIRRLELDAEGNVTHEHYVPDDVLVRWGSKLTSRLSQKARELNDMLTDEDKKEMKARGELTPEEKAKNG